MATLPLLGLVALIVATSALSGVFGMAGGMILMAGLVLVLSVPAAMLLHGLTQAVANGMRVVLLRRHVALRVLPGQLAGALLAVGTLAVFRVVPDAAVVLILVGAMPWLGRLLPVLARANVEQPFTAVACGALVTATQLLAGASGPLLDVFYQSTRLDRFQVIATKALTQATGHLLKLGYYAGFLDAARGELPAWLPVAAIVAAVAGTHAGTRLLAALSETGFRRASGALILGIGAICVARGTWMLFDG
jgi:uncharacterized membrane protein YfcA